MSVRVEIRRLPHSERLPLPRYESSGAAGLDLLAAVAEGSPIELSPGERRLVPTGLVLQLPAGCEGQVRPRSGLALKFGVTVLNAPGTIDSDYRGEVQVLLINLGEERFSITRGLRIAQLVIARVETGVLHEIDVISETIRGAGGFGSTGTGARKADA
jgi:dUTP pyrophosphatase